MVSIGTLECCEKLPTKKLAQHLDREEVVLSRRDPARGVLGEAPSGHDAVQVGMEEEVLAPGMEDGGEADLCAEVLLVTRDSREGR